VVTRSSAPVFLPESALPSRLATAQHPDKTIQNASRSGLNDDHHDGTSREPARLVRHYPCRAHHPILPGLQPIVAFTGVSIASGWRLDSALKQRTEEEKRPASIAAICCPTASIVLDWGFANARMRGPWPAGLCPQVTRRTRPKTRLPVGTDRGMFQCLCKTEARPRAQCLSVADFISSTSLNQFDKFDDALLESSAV
jgi:hypothetical protein